MKTKADFLKSLGLEDFSFRASTLSVSTLPVGGLANTTEDALQRINASNFVKRELTENDVYLHTFEAGSTRFIADRFMFLDASTIRNVAEEAIDGFAFMTKHAKGDGFTDGELPYGRTFAGAVDAKDGFDRAVVQIYMLREHKPNGNAKPSTDDLDKGLTGGTLFDVSLGFKRGHGVLQCVVCEKTWLGSDCPHYPGTTMAMSEDDIERMKARGVPDGKAAISLVNGRPSELSVVYSGAIPNAGTAFSEQSTLFTEIEAASAAATAVAAVVPPTAPASETTSLSTATPRQEEPMYTKELKLKLGLAETANEAEVDAKLTSLNSLATENETLKAQQKADADRAFSEKWTPKLGADLVAQFAGLPNRDALAEQTAKTLAAAAQPTAPAPAIGDPLKGISAAAGATVTAPGVGATKESEEIRTALAVLPTNEAVEKAAMTSGLSALQKVLGLKSVTPDRDFMRNNGAALEQRARIYGITPPATA